MKKILSLLLISFFLISCEKESLDNQISIEQELIAFLESHGVTLVESTDEKMIFHNQNNISGQSIISLLRSFHLDYGFQFVEREIEVKSGRTARDFDCFWAYDSDGCGATLWCVDYDDPTYLEVAGSYELTTCYD